MIKVSTITPCYKMEKYLKLFLDELPKQTIFEEIEVVLDHNEPSKQELEWVKEFQKKYPNRLKHVVTDPVEPIGVSMNTCIKEASGDCLAIWNVDDLRTPSSLEKQYHLIDDKHEMSHGNFIIVNKFGATSGQYVDHTKYPKSENTRGMIFGPFFMFKKDLINKAGYFDEQLKSGADFDLAIRLAANTEIKTTEEILGYYLDEGKGASTRGDGRQPLERTLIELRYGIFDKIEKHYLARATTEFRVRQILSNGEWSPVSNYIKNYNDFIKNNGEK